MATIKILLFSKNIILPGLRCMSTKPNFGLIFDIDGVIVRGKSVIPCVPNAFKRLKDDRGKFRIPTIFVTNSGNSLRSEKAAELSEWIGYEITESQVVLAHSPLELFKQFHKKRALISGQGSVEKIANKLGFNNIITMNELVKNFPSLDYINKNNRDPTCGPVDTNFKPIECILLLSEPIAWETSLQLMVDLLMTNGLPTKLPSELPYPHIPIIACNMDLLWVSEAPIPRYGHGAYLKCLESLYKKVTGKNLIYEALIGKPSEITYYYASQMMINQAKQIGLGEIDTIYAVGDNINTDIFGANLYDKYLGKYSKAKEKTNTFESKNFKSLSGNDLIYPNFKACISVLVETGVHNRDCNYKIEHGPRDFQAAKEDLYKPAFIVENVSKAIDLILKEEKID